MTVQHIAAFDDVERRLLAIRVDTERQAIVLDIYEGNEHARALIVPEDARQLADAIRQASDLIFAQERALELATTGDARR